MAREFLREFFALYKSLPCLWNKKHPKFKDKFLRDTAMLELTKMYRGLAPDATTVSVRKELFTFKSCLTNEHRRMKEALKKGLPVVSELWYYDDLSFLLDSNASEPVVQRARYLNHSDNDFKEKILTPRSFSRDNSAPVAKRRNVAATRKTNVKDKFDLLSEKLRSLPTEQFNFIENILSNIFKFADYENQEWISTSSIISRQETLKRTTANAKQFKSVGTQAIQPETFDTQTMQYNTGGTREIQSKSVGTQAMQSKTVGTQAMQPKTVGTQVMMPKTIDHQEKQSKAFSNEGTVSRAAGIRVIQCQTFSAQGLQSKTFSSQVVQSETFGTQVMHSQTVDTQGMRSQTIDAAEGTSVQDNLSSPCKSDSRCIACSQESVNPQNLIYLC